jgi:hypothetical protein
MVEEVDPAILAMMAQLHVPSPPSETAAGEFGGSGGGLPWRDDTAIALSPSHLFDSESTVCVALIDSNARAAKIRSNGVFCCRENAPDKVGCGRENHGSRPRVPLMPNSYYVQVHGRGVKADSAKIEPCLSKSQVPVHLEELSNQK